MFGICFASFYSQPFNLSGETTKARKPYRASVAPNTIKAALRCQERIKIIIRKIPQKIVSFRKSENKKARESFLYEIRILDPAIQIIITEKKVVKTIV